MISKRLDVPPVSSGLSMRLHLCKFVARKAMRRADKGALSRLIYTLRVTTASLCEERGKSRETRQINSPREQEGGGVQALALTRAGEIYQNSRQQ